MPKEKCRRKNGSFVKKKSYDRYLKGIGSKNSSPPAPEKKFEVKGRRIVDMEELIKNLKCMKCNSLLHFENISNEVRAGMHSTFWIECHSCALLKKVDCGKTNNDGTYENNTSIILGK